MLKEEKKYYTPKTNMAVYATNPSLDQVNLIIKSNKVFAKGNEALIITNLETGEQAPAQSGATFVREELVDTEKFIKLYASGIEHLAELSSPGFKVFQLVYRELLGQKDIDKIFLDYHELKYFEKWKWSQVTFISGMHELLKKEILFKAIGANQYFINVNLFFNGNRINIVNSYRIRDQDSVQPSLLDDIG